MSKSDEPSAPNLSLEELEVHALTDASLGNLFAVLVKEIADRADRNLKFRLFAGDKDVTVNDVMLAATEMLHAKDVEVFELTLWQSFTGRTAARRLRHFEAADPGAEQ